MKKRVFGLAVLCCVLLSACRQPSQEPVSSSAVSTPSAVSSSSSQAYSSDQQGNSDFSDKDQSQTNVKTFGASHAAFIDSVKPIAQENYASLFSSDPTIKEHEASDTLPETISYSFPVGNAASLILYDIKDSGELYEVFLTFDTSTEDTISIREIGFVNGIMMAALEPDQSVREQIDQKLNCSNITENSITFASGTAADWTYMVDGSFVSLMAMAK